MAQLTTYPRLETLLGLVFGDGDKMTTQQLIADADSVGISIEDLATMEASINARPEFWSELPFPGENSTYDRLVKFDHGFALIQQFVDQWA